MRSTDECVSSTLNILRERCPNDLQLCADAAEAIPSTYGKVDAAVAEFGERTGTSKSAVYARRDAGLKWSRVMPEFPPRGQFQLVDYTVYRDLPAHFGGDMEAAFAFLKWVVENVPMHERGRWNRGLVLKVLRGWRKAHTGGAAKKTVSAGSSSGATNSGPTATRETAAADGPERAATDTAAGPPAGGQPSVPDAPAALDEQLIIQAHGAGLDTRRKLRLHLEAAQEVLSGLEGDEADVYGDVERAVEAALAALQAADQLSLGG